MFNKHLLLISIILSIILSSPMAVFAQSADENGNIIYLQSIYKPGSQKTSYNSIGQKFVYINPGSFMMGSYGYDKDEAPVHKVTISNGFYMQTTEVTQGQWFNVMKTRPWIGKPGVINNKDCPVVYISWYSAKEFVRRLSMRDGKQYRLPTEAEWEYACRAGTTTLFSFGNNISMLDQYAWYNKNAKFAGRKYGQRVGTKLPNPWGLYNMHGNVYEFCEDWYGKNYYRSYPVNDPRGPDFGTYKVIRGVSWADRDTSLRSSNRNRTKPDRQGRYTGFRVVYN